MKAGWLIAAAALVAAACGGGSKPAAPSLPNRDGVLRRARAAERRAGRARTRRGRRRATGRRGPQCPRRRDRQAGEARHGRRWMRRRRRPRRRGEAHARGRDARRRVRGPARAAARAFGTADMPFLVTSANSPRIVNPDRAPTTYLTDGTPYQEALAVVHWLATTQTQRLAVVGDADAASSYLTLQVAGLSDPTPHAVSRQTVPKSGADFASPARIALVSKPDVVYFAGTPAHSGRMLAALRAAGFKGRFVASASSETRRSCPRPGRRPMARSSWPTPARRTCRPRRAGRSASPSGSVTRRGATRCWPTTRCGRWPRRSRSPARSIAPPTAARSRCSIRTSSRRSWATSQFAPDHTVKDDNHIVLTVRDGAFRVATTLRSFEG